MRIGRRGTLVGLTTLAGTVAAGATSAEPAPAVVPSLDGRTEPSLPGTAPALADRNAGYEALYPPTGLTERERVAQAHALTPAGAEVRALFGPLADGTSFRAADGTHWNVAAIYEPRGGVLPVVLSARSALGTKVSLELMLDGEDGPRAPARAAGLAGFVTNGGDGSTATREQQGLAAMALVLALAPRFASSGVSSRLSTYGARGPAVAAV